MLTAEQSLQPGSGPQPLRTLEDVKQCVAARVTQSASLQAKLARRQRLVRRAALLAGLGCSTFQYYFLSVGVHILSMPSLTVFLR